MSVFAADGKGNISLPEETTVTVSAADELAVDFGIWGLWHYSDTWSLLTSWMDPQVIAAWDGGLAVGFGSGTGIWNYDGVSWSQLTGWLDPEDMAPLDVQ